MLLIIVYLIIATTTCPPCYSPPHSAVALLSFVSTITTKLNNSAVLVLVRVCICHFHILPKWKQDASRGYSARCKMHLRYSVILFFHAVGALILLGSCQAGGGRAGRGSLMMCKKLAESTMPVQTRPYTVRLRVLVRVQSHVLMYRYRDTRTFVLGTLMLYGMVPVPLPYPYSTCPHGRRLT